MHFFAGILKAFIVLAFVGVLLFQFREYIPFLASVPCQEPIPYALGTFDTRFNINEEYFLKALKEAEEIWEKPTGQNLFVFQPQKEQSSILEKIFPENILKVSLIYDYRQQTTNKLEDIGERVKVSQESYDSLRARFETLKTEYEKERAKLDAEADQYSRRKALYEKEVNIWNQRGGAPEAEFVKLEKERKALNEEGRALEVLQNKVNSLAQQVNTTVSSLNQMAGTLNLSVEKYNAVNEERGETFEEGIYETDGIERKITIYEFSTREKLIRVLAHELGHALSLEHVGDEEAIMYEFNEDNALVLTLADMEELRSKCEPNK